MLTFAERKRRIQAHHEQCLAEERAAGIDRARCAASCPICHGAGPLPACRAALDRLVAHNEYLARKYPERLTQGG